MPPTKKIVSAFIFYFSYFVCQFPLKYESRVFLSFCFCLVYLAYCSTTSCTSQSRHTCVPHSHTYYFFLFTLFSSSSDFCFLCCYSTCVKIKRWYTFTEICSSLISPNVYKICTNITIWDLETIRFAFFQNSTLTVGYAPMVLQTMLYSVPAVIGDGISSSTLVTPTIHIHI